MKTPKPTEDEFNKIRLKLKNLSNAAQYGKAYKYAKTLRKLYPSVPLFSYYEAVMYGDDTKGLSKQEISKRHKKAAAMIYPWLKRLRAIEPRMRSGFRNEFYWFSHQPYKQYLLGVEGVKKFRENGSHYSMGVGAVELARNYFTNGKISLGIKWSKRAEIAWLGYFIYQKNWYNSYCWYAESLGFQGKLKEMEAALARAAKISKNPKTFFEFKQVRDEVERVRLLRLWETLMIKIFDHTYTHLKNSTLDECLDRYEKAGFTLSPNKMRHPAGHYNGFVKLSGSYLEFISIVDEEEFNREATDDDRYFRNNPKPFAIGATSDNVDNIYEKLVSQYPDLPKTYSRGEAGLNDGPLLWSFLTLPTSVLSGANVFCLKYLKSPSLMYDLKVSNNGTYAVGGFVFCTNDPISRCREWESILTIVADKVSRIDEREIFSAERTLNGFHHQNTKTYLKGPGKNLNVRVARLQQSNY